MCLIIINKCSTIWHEFSKNGLKVVEHMQRFVFLPNFWIFIIFIFETLKACKTGNLIKSIFTIWMEFDVFNFLRQRHRQFEKGLEN